MQRSFGMRIWYGSLEAIKKIDANRKTITQNQHQQKDHNPKSIYSRGSHTSLAVIGVKRIKGPQMIACLASARMKNIFIRLEMNEGSRAECRWAFPRMKTVCQILVGLNSPYWEMKAKIQRYRTKNRGTRPRCELTDRIKNLSLFNRPTMKHMSWKVNRFTTSGEIHNHQGS